MTDSPQIVLRIAIDCRMLGWGGVGRYTKGLVQGLQSPKASHKFIIICNSDHCFDDMPDNFEANIVDQPVFSNKANWALSKVLNNLELDIFHSPHFIYPWFYKGKGIVTIHDLIPFRYPDTMFMKDRLKFSAAVRLAARKASHIISVSESTKKDIVELLGKPAAKITTIYESVDNNFSDKQTDAGDYTDLPSDFLLYVGAFRLHKNIDGILRSYMQLPQDIKEKYPLVFIGKEDPRYLDFSKLVKQLGLERNVIRMENVPEYMLANIYRRAKILLMPSFYEGFGLPALESMSCGTPVIASNVSSFPEVLGDSAILVDPYDHNAIASAILSVIKDDKLCRLYADKGLKRAAEYSWERTARETVAVYEKVASS